MIMMKRLFIGLPIESEIAAKHTETWKNDRLLNQNRMSWAKPENWHITLFFLGVTPESGIALLQQLIAESFNADQAFSTQLSGVGIFPHERNPKVLWLGLENLELLMPAYAQLGDLLRQNGFSFDNKPLKPHLTLARIKSFGNAATFESLLKQYRQFNFGKVAINRVVLFESNLTPNGPVYKPLFVKWLEQPPNPPNGGL
jgi:2'-5' RNA ligase